MMEEIRNCPFCDNEAAIEIIPGVKLGTYKFIIRCNNNKCIANYIYKSFDIKEDAIEEWNKRGIGETLDFGDEDE